MTKYDDMFKKAFSTLKKEALPTQQQKDAILSRILMESKANDVSTFGQLSKMVTVYPWRFAFVVSAIQAVPLTLIFGTKYTNLFLGFFGG